VPTALAVDGRSLPSQSTRAALGGDRPGSTPCGHSRRPGWITEILWHLPASTRQAVNRESACHFSSLTTHRLAPRKTRCASDVKGRWARDSFLLEDRRSVSDGPMAPSSVNETRTRIRLRNSSGRLPVRTCRPSLAAYRAQPSPPSSPSSRRSIRRTGLLVIEPRNQHEPSPAAPSRRHRRRPPPLVLNTPPAFTVIEPPVSEVDAGAGPLAKAHRERSCVSSFSSSLVTTDADAHVATVFSFRGHREFLAGRRRLATANGGFRSPDHSTCRYVNALRGGIRIDRVGRAAQPCLPV